MPFIDKSTLYYLLLIVLIAIIVFIVVYKLVQKPTQPTVTAAAQTVEVVLSNSNPSATVTLNTLSTTTITIAISNAPPSTTYTIQYDGNSTSITTDSSGTATTTITYTPPSYNATFVIIIRGPGIINNNNNQLVLRIVFAQPSATPTPTSSPPPLNLKQITVSGDYYMTITSTPNNEITDAVVPTPITIYAPVGYYVNLFNKSNMSYVQSFQIS